MAVGARSDSHVPRELTRYLIPSETIIFCLRRHWIVLLEPVTTMLLALMLLVALGARTPGILVNIVGPIWLGLLLRAGWHVFERHHELFLATNKRLMLVHGLLTRKVDIMPMSKVTDMRYDRSVTGQLFGYGEFVLESAGQDQALSRINFIPDPDQHYQEISAVIFAPAQHSKPATGRAPAGARLPISEPEPAWWLRPFLPRP